MSPFLSPYPFHPRPSNICERTFSNTNTYKFQVRLLSFFNNLRPPHGTLPPQSPPFLSPYLSHPRPCNICERTFSDENPYKFQVRLLSFFNHLRPPHGTLPPQSPPSARPNNPWQAQWANKHVAYHNIPNQNFEPPTSSPSINPFEIQETSSVLLSPPRPNPGRDNLRDQISLPLEVS